MENLQGEIIMTDEGAQEAQAPAKKQKKDGFVARIIHKKDQLMANKKVRRVVHLVGGAAAAGACWLSYKAGIKRATPVTVEVKEALPEKAAEETEQEPVTEQVDQETGEVIVE